MHRAILAYAAPVLLALFAGEASGQGIALEHGIDRPGSDYRNYASPSASACAADCQRESGCKAFTFVRPNTVQGPRGRCWLKTVVPRGQRHACCISGVKRATAAANPPGSTGGYPPGCLNVNDRKPYATLRIVNRVRYPVSVQVSGWAGTWSITPGRTVSLGRVLRIGRTIVRYRVNAPNPTAWRNITYVVNNNGPRTCGVVKTLTFRP